MQQYILTHLKMGIYIEYLLEKTAIHNIELSIIDQKFTLFPELYDKKTFWWVNEENYTIKFFNFCPKDFVYLTFSQNFEQFTESFNQKFPLINDIGFLNYLSQWMNKDQVGDCSFDFDKSSIGDDLNKFWGNNIKSFLLYKKMSEEIRKPDDNRLEMIEKIHKI